jgi:hypothetical protein
MREVGVKSGPKVSQYLANSLTSLMMSLMEKAIN